MLDERDYFMKENRLDPAFHSQEQEREFRAEADSDSDSDDDVDARERLIEELAKRTQFTMDELRDRDDEFLQKLVESLDLDADDLDAVLNARVDAIEEQVSALEGGDVDLANFSAGGSASDRESETNVGDDDVEDHVGGAFTTAARGD